MIISPKTDINLRTENQDVFGHFDTPYGALLLVCDGMGGAQAGHAAADYAAARFPQLLRDAYARDVPVREALHQTAEEINRRIFDLGSSGDPQYRGMGTTLVLALRVEEGFLIGHVGDSRAYLHRDGKLIPLTRDHAPVADLLARGVINAHQARNHPRRSVLSRAIGPQPSAPLTLREDYVAWYPGDSLILCSDGLCGFVDDADIEHALNALTDVREAAEVLVALAKTYDSDDNITVLVASEPPRAPDLFTDTAGFDEDGPAPTRKAPRPTIAAVPTTPASASAEASHAAANPAAASPGNTLSARYPSRMERLVAYLQRRDTQVTLCVLVLAAVIGLFFTWLHYKHIYQMTPYVPAPPLETPREEITEVESVRQYGWTAGECPLGLVEQARFLMSDFERELRRSAALDVAEEIELGDRYAAEFAFEYGDAIDNDPAWTRYINQVGNLLAARATRREITYAFHYVDDPLENAVSLPGGHIYVFRGLLDRYIHNEAQLAFVLAHEIKHVDNRHALAFERVVRQIPREIREAAGGSLSYFINQPFSSAREEEADAEGLKLMFQGGYAPGQAVVFVQGMVADTYTEEAPAVLWDRMLKEADDFFSTHPSLALRECRLRNEVLHMIKTGEDTPLYVGHTNYRERIPKSDVMF